MAFRVERRGRRITSRKITAGFKTFTCLTSDSEQSGEGEFKIFQYLNNLATSQEQQSTTPSSTTTTTTTSATSATSSESSSSTTTTTPSTAAANRSLVVSNDSDVVLFALLSRYRDIDVLRVQSSEDAVLIDVATLRAQLAIMCQVDPNDAELMQRVVQDFVFLTLLLGTDYTPPCRQYEFMTTLQAYRRMRQRFPSWFIVDLKNDTVDPRVLAKVLRTRYDEVCLWFLI